MEKKTESKKETETAPQQELVDLLKKTQANLENYRKQQEKRILEIQQSANKELILQLLPVLDNLELALKNSDADPKEFLKGVELIHSQFVKVLKEQGVQTIETKTALFDPNKHEALMKVDSEEPENKIIEEFQKGFLLNDNVIRCAKVKVSAGKKEDTKIKKTDGGQ